MLCRPVQDQPSNVGCLFAALCVLVSAPAICGCRRSRDVDGPLYRGKDTHALATVMVDTGKG